MLYTVIKMHQIRFHHIFNTSETRRDRKNVIADLDSAPESYPYTLFRFSDTKFLLDSVIRVRNLAYFKGGRGF